MTAKIATLSRSYEASPVEVRELGMRRAAHVYVAASRGIGGKDEAIRQLKLAALEWAIEAIKTGEVKL